MEKPNKDLYSHFLLSTFGRHSIIWLARLLDNQPSHDSWTRWLSNAKLRPRIIWEDVQKKVDLSSGYLVIDDSVADKWYSKQIDLVKRQYSGTHHRLVDGIGVVSLLWTKSLEIERAEHMVVDFRIYAPKYDGKSKHEHARDMLESALYRGFVSPVVVMDGWYSATETLKFIHRELKWAFVVALAHNRQVKKDVGEDYRSVADFSTASGKECWMKAFGKVKVFKLVRPKDGDIEYLATNDLSLTAPDVRTACACRWKIEEYHRGAKQLTGLERCQFRNQRAQRNHILCSIRALLALEQWRLERGISWYETKQQLITESLSQYLKAPTIPLVRAST